jgi:epoxyqueuosine reductase
MRPRRAPVTVDEEYVAQLRALAASHGVHHAGVAPAEVLHRARAALIERQAAGLADGLGFTYRNPRRSTDPRQAVAAAHSIFVGARSYLIDHDPPPPTKPSGRIARYAWTDAYAPLRAGLATVVARLRADGFRAVAFADDNSLVDREVAYLAGIGWFGKNANLLIPGRGSWFVLGAVVTTAPLPVAEQPVADGCGACARCIDACPTGAIVADGVIDARRCLAWVMQKPGSIPSAMRVAIADRLYGCDDCQTSCPPTIRWGRREQVVDEGEQIVAWRDLVQLLDADDDTAIDLWGRWYLADRNPRWIRRNALVALGNVLADRSPDDPGRLTALAAIDRYASGADELLAEHARWAASRAAGNLAADPA